MAQNIVGYSIGNGQHTYLRWDARLPFGPLIQRYGLRVIYDFAFPLPAKIANVFHGNFWCWAPTRSDALVEIQIPLCHDLQPVEN